MLEHYKNKKYWSKIEKLFEQEGVDAVLAWEDSIRKYKHLKDKLEETENENAELRNELKHTNEKIISLEKQMVV